VSDPDGAAYDAIVLAGGSARRLDGVDKPGLLIGGVSLLDRVLAAVDGADRTVVVGPARVTARPVEWVREDPPGSGPVAGLAAGVAKCAAPVVLTLAADLPWIAPAISRLTAAVSDLDVAVLVDGSGRRSLLTAAWRRASLVAALDRVDAPAGVAVRRLFDGAAVVEVADEGGWSEDCDTWEAIERARARMGA
jgi:molybdopterin-guanine dinucleotide biosynthesis protein A